MQHLSSIDCVSNMNPGPALLGLRLRARGLSSLVLQSLKLQRRVLNRPNLRGVSQMLTGTIVTWDHCDVGLPTMLEQHLVYS